jgi:L,D-peptidoglycan transpeptidase YkuD (ErfK/YbiS/YcfS/YnhG family)
VPRRRRPQTVLVLGLSAASPRGIVKLGGLTLACALGRRGRSARKRESDGATPVGCWRVIGVLYRADRVRRPATRLPVRRLFPRDGWCDAPEDRNYNRPVRHPYPASAEELWRADGLYDLIVVLSHNTRPRVRGAGSAVFMHVARPDYRPTEGCIALRRDHLRRLVERLRSGARIGIRP